MSERQRIINIVLFARLVGNTSVADLARAGNVDAQVAVYEGFQGNMREVTRSSCDAIRAAKLSVIKFLENQMLLINEEPIGGDYSNVVFHC